MDSRAAVVRQSTRSELVSSIARVTRTAAALRERAPTPALTRERALARAFTCEAFEGASLTDLVKFDSSDGARQLAEHIECACSGVMACSTCHVVVDPIWYEAVGAADEDEEDMLDLAHDPRRTSRLGCQVKLTPALDGLVVWVPHGANNMMDDIPEWSTDR